MKNDVHENKLNIANNKDEFVFYQQHDGYKFIYSIAVYYLINKI